MSQKHMIAGRDRAAGTGGFSRKSGGEFGRFLGHPGPMHDGPRHAEGGCRLAHGQVGGPHDVSERAGWRSGRPSRLPEARTLARPARTRSAIRARSNSARAARTCSCSRPAAVVQSIPSPKRHERDADGLHILQQRHEVLQIAPEPIQPPDDQDVESPTPGVRHQAVEGRATVLGPADPLSMYSTAVQPRASAYRRSS